MRPRALRPRFLAGVVAVSALLSLGAAPLPARAGTLVTVTGAGSTWSSNAMDQWIGDVHQYGINIDFAATGSSDGRTQFKNDTVDFGVSEIPYGITDNGTYEPPPSRSYAYMPIVAGGTSFMYQLHINGQQVSNLRLSGEVVAKIFTDNITKWNDPAIQADNPGIVLPPEPIVPVVRSDGSGTTAQLTTWMSKLYPDLWNAYCAKTGRVVPCGVTSTYPVISSSSFVPQQLSTGVAGYITQSQSEGTIGYVETSYAKQLNYPVAKVLNAAGYYAEPTADNVAVALTAAQINTDPTSPSYLTQELDGVYANPDPRTYPLSSYSYMIIPTALQGQMTTDKGYTLGKFAYYFLCEGQQSMGDLGYSPLPINLVQAALAQVAKIPGVDVQSTDISACDNPTFDPATGANKLAETAPQPQPCDKLGVTMCPTRTGGAPSDTYVSAPAATTAPPAAAVTTAPAEPGKAKPGKHPGAPVLTKPKRRSGAPAAPTSTPAPGAQQTAPGPAAVTGGHSQNGPAISQPSGGAVSTSATKAPALAAAPAPTTSDPFGDGAAPAAVTQVAAQGGAGSGGQPEVVAAIPPVRAVSVSVAVGTGWSLQDTLMVMAFCIFAALTVGPPVLSRRLRRRS